MTNCERQAEATEPAALVETDGVIQRLTGPAAVAHHGGRDFWIVVSLLALLTLAISIVARFVAYLPGDVRIEQAYQSVGLPVLGGLMHIENALGSPWPAVTIISAVAVVLFLVHDRRLALVFLLANALRGVGSLVKDVVNRPRPSASLVHVTDHASGASFPSGHVFSAVLLYGMLAILLEAVPLPRPVRRSLQLLCLAVILLMGPARVYSGAHWPSDVIGGYLWGTTLLLLAIRAGLAVRLLPSPLRSGSNHR